MSRTGLVSIWLPGKKAVTPISQDKPPLTFYEIKRTIDQFQNDESWMLTSAGRFSEKVEMFPNSVFIIGADTLLRVFDEKFYKNLYSFINNCQFFLCPAAIKENG